MIHTKSGIRMLQPFEKLREPIRIQAEHLLEAFQLIWFKMSGLILEE